MKKRLSIVMLVSLCLAVLFFTACAVTPSAVITEIITVVAGILPIISGVASALLPGEATLINTAQQLAESELKALLSVVQEYEANPSDTILGKVQEACTAVHDNLAQLEAAAHVKDAKTSDKITRIVNSAMSMVAMLESAILQKHPARVAAANPS